MSTQEDIKHAASKAADTAKSAAADAAGKAKDHAAMKASDAKDTVATEVQNVSSALRTASNEMRNGSPQERFMGQLAGSLADVSDEIHNKDVGEILNATTDFARRNPAAFLGGAALLGFAATRFMKASQPSATGSTDFADAPRTHMRVPS